MEIGSPPDVIGPTEKMAALIKVLAIDHITAMASDFHAAIDLCTANDDSNGLRPGLRMQVNLYPLPHWISSALLSFHVSASIFSLMFQYLELFCQSAYPYASRKWLQQVHIQEELSYIAGR